MNQEPGTAGRDRVADPVGPGDERAAARLKAQPVQHLPLQCIGDPVGQVIRPADIARLESARERTLQLVLRDRVFKRSEEHTSELQSLMRISYAVFCLKK